MIHRIVAISDIHFGIESSTLNNSEIIDAFTDELKNNGPVDEFILLGDIFELWKYTPKEALSNARHFLSIIHQISGKVTYVIGNHDHHFFILCQETDFLKNIKESNIKDINFSPEQEFGRSILEGLIHDNCEVNVRYARYWKENQGTKILFMHGHHLDALQTFTPGLINRIRLFIKKIRGLEDYVKLPENAERFEAALASTYELLYRNATAKEIVEVESGLWTIFTFGGLIKSHICRTLRFTPIQQMYSLIEEYLARLGDQPEIFVYGHTHSADAYKKDHRVLAVNTGCWLKEEDPSIWANPEQIPNTYVVIDDEVTVRELGKEDPLVGPFPISKIPTLEFAGRQSMGRNFQ